MNRLFDNLRKNKYLIFAIFWILTWLLPWSDWLLSKWLRLGGALLLFAIPGVIFSVLLVDAKFEFFPHLVIGFVISVFCVEFLGLLGRFFHFPFSYIKPTFALLGLVGIWLFYYRARIDFTSLVDLNGFFITCFSMVILSLFSIFYVIVRSNFGGDDASYLAVVTKSQYDTSLGFEEMFFGTGQLDRVRFWMAMFPLVLAFIAELSNLHGLLLMGYYLPPFLIVLGLLSLFSLNKYFLKSNYQAIASLLFQFSFYIMLRSTQQVGVTFFGRLAEDKVFAAFIIAPIFFVVFDNFIRKPNLRNGLLVLLVGWGHALTHPIILFFTLFIAGIQAILFSFVKTDFRKVFLAGSIILLTVIPVAPLRFVDEALLPKTFDLEGALNSKIVTKTRISYIEGTPFYGFHPERIQIFAPKDRKNVAAEFFSWSFLWLVILGFVWALVNLRKSDFAPFIAAATLLLLLSLLPYTGWVIGKFVTARMLWRTPWLVPIGIIVTVLLTYTVELFQNKIKANNQPYIQKFVFFAGFIFALFFIIPVYQSQLPKWDTKSEYLYKISALANFGKYIEDNIPQPARFITSNDLMDYIPGLSSKSLPVLFRNPNYTQRYTKEPSITQQEISVVLSQRMETPMSSRLEILQKYNIRYILHESGRLKNIYLSYPQWYTATKIDRFWLIEFHPSEQ